MATTATLIVCNWHTECGGCRYGSGGWASNKDRPILTPESKVCPGCGATFVNTERAYTS